MLAVGPLFRLLRTRGQFDTLGRSSATAAGPRTAAAAARTAACHLHPGTRGPCRCCRRGRWRGRDCTWKNIDQRINTGCARIRCKWPGRCQHGSCDSASSSRTGRRCKPSCTASNQHTRDLSRPCRLRPHIDPLRTLSWGDTGDLCPSRMAQFRTRPPRIAGMSGRQCHWKRSTAGTGKPVQGHTARTYCTQCCWRMCMVRQQMCRLGKLSNPRSSGRWRRCRARSRADLGDTRCRLGNDGQNLASAE